CLIMDYEVWPPQGVDLQRVTAAKLQLGSQTRITITCVNVSTDYAGATAIPAWARYIMVYAANDFIVAVDEATTAAIGAAMPAATPQVFPIAFGSGDSKVHAQSPVAGTIVNVSYLRD
ncbi:MAG: hypothetical protein Q8R92_16665, partial [Deltaproteobacteria bacterium]|nr:hypothetical protein [Deltaproteobacteria bacterium]